MNAWTGPDFTAFPFSTRNKKDFVNLLKVYLDAAFKPMLDEKDFWQEGWRWEINQNEDLNVNGIVFNEMKGAFESQNSYLQEQVFKNLFQGSEYGNCHGGEPEEIMNLTYQDFKNFHKENYHPSNCTIVTYGDMSPEEYVSVIEDEYLKYFDIKSFSIIPSPPEILKNKKMTIDGPPNMETIRPGYDGQFTLSFLCRDLEYKSSPSNEDLINYRGLQLLKTLLFDFPKSPFYKKFLETGIAGGFSGMNGFDENVYYPYFSIGRLAFNS
jgi:Zn-dependent M16 (insulinase) family peptidase